jgi:hypothetical protein
MTRQTRGYQLHLSTLLALMLLAGVLVWLNAREQTIYVGWLSLPDTAYERDDAEVIDHGWPYTFIRKLDSGDVVHNWFWRSLCLDAVFCLLLLALAIFPLGFTCKSLLQRTVHHLRS